MAGEITVTSDHFEDDGTIPTSAAHSYGGGENRSPHLAWAGLPEGTKSVAVTIWDGMGAGNPLRAPSTPGGFVWPSPVA